MKVKIQLTIDIEEVQQEVVNRLNKVMPITEYKKEELETIIKHIADNNIITACDSIDKLRSDIAYLDSVLEDSYKILTGYTAYKAKNLESSLLQEKGQKDDSEQ